MFGYYWGLARQAPGIAAKAFHRVFLGATVLATCALVLGRGWADALSAPSLYALIPAGVLFLYGLLRANYLNVKALQEQVDRRDPAPQRVIHEYRERSRFPDEIRHLIESQSAHQRQTLERLHQEYVETHPRASRRIRLKTDPLPKAWAERRLAHMGETWRQDEYRL